ncbi:uncharacterized protein BYT42DRAFT_505142 [Radiomyces spectabilis]|uniref:uncharacterized protein n=1 Tax=Radiomyces spectabilis TaxID=64574 RepID=UPI00221EA394|nr:uncharacterized protein BYT42DRAFT_505142 [Radiomyces spectabilis]KAI8365952.1 hypothetical protein BYT42DRAFT_505142 [Radiomyces spectabilis]
MDFVIIQRPIVLRLAVAGLLISSFFIPYIRRFTVPALPIFTWLITFYACQFIPLDYRPHHIFVNILPTLERILYGASLSEIISQHTHPILDVLAWLPYGVIHFSFPFILALCLFVFGPPGCVATFGQAFGFMNIAGVLTQLLFPNASPWYEMSYGSAPADYSIPGEAGGLARIDKILGLNLYGSTFGTSPLVFGAFPSLHSGSATIEMLFLVYLCPKLWPLGIAYTMWLWWSTMYLTHHYLIDLVGGSIYAFLTFFVARQYLPRVRMEAKTRLAYFGVNKIGIPAFFYSIEPSKPSFVSLQDDEEALLSKEYNPDKQTDEMSEAPLNLDFVPLRLRRTDSDNDSLVLSPASLTSGTSSATNSEPTSPVTPHSPMSFRLPYGEKP